MSIQHIYVYNVWADQYFYIHIHIGVTTVLGNGVYQVKFEVSAIRSSLKHGHVHVHISFVMAGG